jgi:hypothetical protein
MTKILRAGQDTWALHAMLKGREVVRMIRHGDSISDIWWGALVAAHRANQVLKIEARLRRILPPKSVQCSGKCAVERVQISCVQSPAQDNIVIHKRKPGRRKVYE